MWALVASMALTGAVLTSCSGGGASAPAGDPIFSEMTKVVDEYGPKGMTLIEGLKDAKTKDDVKAFQKEMASLDSATNAALDAALATMRDKEFPTEVAGDVPLKVVTPFKLNADESKNEKMELVAVVENTADTWNSDNPDGFRFSHLRVMFVDGNGKPVCAPDRERYEAKGEGDTKHKAGEKGEVTVKLKMELWNAPLLSQACKVVITAVEDDNYKVARDTTAAAGRAFMERMRELQSGLRNVK